MQQLRHILLAEFACICRHVCLPDHLKNRRQRLCGIEVIFERSPHFLQSYFRQIGELWAARVRKIPFSHAKLEFTQPVNRSCRLSKPIKRKVELIAERHRSQQIADGRRFVSQHNQITESKKIAQALRHLLSFHQQKAHVHPEVRERLSCQRL